MSAPTVRDRREGRPLLIGVTGPIGCGKSTVARWLGALGARVIDADEVAREVLEPGTPELASVVAAFGADLLLADGRLDRPALARIVFADSTALRRLEAIVHPAVRPRIVAAFDAATQDGVPAVVVEAIKLVEGGLADLCDEVWLITCETGAQATRLAARGMSAADVQARTATQAGMVARLWPRADRVIDTSGREDETRAAVARGLADALSS